MAQENAKEVNEKTVEKKPTTTLRVTQKTKYHTDDVKTYPFDVILNFDNVEVQELYQYAAKALIIAARPGWKEAKVLEQYEESGEVFLYVREFLDRERTRRPTIITAENLAKQMEIPLETAEMLMQAMRENPATLQEQLTAMTGSSS
jgi:hypothetical protein